MLVLALMPRSTRRARRREAWRGKRRAVGGGMMIVCVFFCAAQKPHKPGLAFGMR